MKEAQHEYTHDHRSHNKFSIVMKSWTFADSLEGGRELPPFRWWQSYNSSTHPATLWKHDNWAGTTSSSSEGVDPCCCTRSKHSSTWGSWPGNPSWQVLGSVFWWFSSFNQVREDVFPLSPWLPSSHQEPTVAASRQIFSPSLLTADSAVSSATKLQGVHLPVISCHVFFGLTAVS